MESNELTTKQDLLNFKQDLINEISSLLKTKSSDQPEWLKSKDIRKMLGISSGTLQTLRINSTLPYSKIGGTIYYAYADVMKVLNQNKRNTGSHE